ncbi:uncharacterized protein Dsimw501_GD28225 [Drosophila simulans]|nr:uncharacterized protein Dsimw501_GD28225 [Drosophila simulans]
MQLLIGFWITLAFVIYIFAGHIYNPKRILRVKDPDSNLNFAFFLYLLKPLASHEACFADYDNPMSTNRYRKMTEVSFNNKYNRTCRLHYNPHYKFTKSKITSETTNENHYRTHFLNTILSWRNAVFNLFPAWNYHFFWKYLKDDIIKDNLRISNSIISKFKKDKTINKPNLKLNPDMNLRKRLSQNDEKKLIASLSRITRKENFSQSAIVLKNLQSLDKRNQLQCFVQLISKKSTFRRCILFEFITESFLSAWNLLGNLRIKSRSQRVQNLQIECKHIQKLSSTKRRIVANKLLESKKLKLSKIGLRLNSKILRFFLWILRRRISLLNTPRGLKKKRMEKAEFFEYLSATETPELFDNLEHLENNRKLNFASQEILELHNQTNLKDKQHIYIWKNLTRSLSKDDNLNHIVTKVNMSDYQSKNTKSINPIEDILPSPSTKTYNLGRFARNQGLLLMETTPIISAKINVSSSDSDSTSDCELCSESLDETTNLFDSAETCEECASLSSNIFDEPTPTISDSSSTESNDEFLQNFSYNITEHATYTRNQSSNLPKDTTATIFISPSKTNINTKSKLRTSIVTTRNPELMSASIKYPISKYITTTIDSTILERTIIIFGYFTEIITMIIFEFETITFSDDTEPNSDITGYTSTECIKCSELTTTVPIETTIERTKLSETPLQLNQMSGPSVHFSTPKKGQIITEDKDQHAREEKSGMVPTTKRDQFTADKSTNRLASPLQLNAVTDSSIEVLNTKIDLFDAEEESKISEFLTENQPSTNNGQWTHTEATKLSQSINHIKNHKIKIGQNAEASFHFNILPGALHTISTTERAHPTEIKKQSETLPLLSTKSIGLNMCDCTCKLQIAKDSCICECNLKESTSDISEGVTARSSKQSLSTETNQKLHSMKDYAPNGTSLLTKASPKPFSIEDVSTKGNGAGKKTTMPSELSSLVKIEPVKSSKQSTHDVCECTCLLEQGNDSCICECLTESTSEGLKSVTASELSIYLPQSSATANSLLTDSSAEEQTIQKETSELSKSLPQLTTEESSSFQETSAEENQMTEVPWKQPSSRTKNIFSSQTENEDNISQEDTRTLSTSFPQSSTTANSLLTVSSAEAHTIQEETSELSKALPQSTRGENVT